MPGDLVMSSPSLVIVGGGNMGAALARGLVAKKFLLPSELVIVEKSSDRRAILSKEFPESVISEQILNCDSVIVAVKPNDVAEICSTLKNFGVKQLLSIAAGVTIASIESACGNSISVVRAMPNTPALIGQGASAMAASVNCSSDQILWAKKILQSVGKVVEVEENLLDAVTAHGYPANPDEFNIGRIQKLLKTHAPKAAARQGETGAPSSKTIAALSQYQWTENKQAKWNLRRMMQHNGRNIPFNLFTIIDLKYAQTDLKGMNRKGLLFANEDMTVARPKLSYFAAQNVFSIFDDSFKPARSLKTPSPVVSLFAYQKKDSSNAVVTAWINNAPPTDSAETTPKDITIPGVVFTDPVYVDLISGKVYRFPKDQWSSDKKSTTFTKVPLWDCPIAIAEASLIPLK